MYKRIISILLLVLAAVSVCALSTLGVSAEGVAAEATADEATVDESTADESEIVITDSADVPITSVEGTVIGYVGDVDLSQKVNIKDATAVQKYMAKLISFSEQSKALADADISGTVNIKDATYIQKYLANFLSDSKIMCVMYQTGSHVHNHIETEVPATCINEGYTGYSCICGDEYKENITPVIEHNYEAKVVKPTCTEQGYTAHTCSMCKDTYKDNYTAVKNHSYKTQKIEPTCTEGGYTILKCVNCDYSYKDREVPPSSDNHSFKKGACTICGVLKVDYSFDALAEYIKKNGEYVSEDRAYYTSLEYVYEGDAASLVYSTADNGIAIVYIMNNGGYIDVLSLAVIKGESEFAYLLLCDEAFQSAGSMDMQKFTEEVEYISDMEFYFFSDIPEDEANHYTVGFIKTVLSVYNANYAQKSVPVSIQDLGFTNY